MRGAKEGRQQKSGYVNAGRKKSEKEEVNLNVGEGGRGKESKGRNALPRQAGI